MGVWKDGGREMWSLGEDCWGGEGQGGGDFMGEGGLLNWRMANWMSIIVLQQLWGCPVDFCHLSPMGCCMIAIPFGRERTCQGLKDAV